MDSLVKHLFVDQEDIDENLKDSKVFFTVANVKDKAFLLFLNGHLCLLQSFASLMRAILVAGYSSFVFVNTNKH